MNFKITLFATVLSLSSLALSADWWNSDWHYRIPVEIETGDNIFINKFVQVPVDFHRDLAGINAFNKIIDPGSVRVLEVDSRGRYIKQVLAQLDVDLLIWKMDGETPSYSSRFYHIYFNTSEFPADSLKIDPLVVKSDLPGRWEFQTPGGYYVFEKNGGAFEIFSPLKCADNEYGVDWMRDDFSKWNGILNVGDPDTKAIFHPNEDEEADDSISRGPRSQLVYAGPLRYRLQSINRFGDLENDYRSRTVYYLFYDIFPDHIKATITRGNESGYACIMELTPGGDKLEETDYVVRSDGLKKFKGEKWSEDISPEWLYIGDSQDSTRLFFVHAEDDTIKDGLNWYENMEAAMVGWGRRANPGIHTYPNTFYLGFTSEKSHDEIKRLVNSLVDEPKISLGTLEAAPGSQGQRAAGKPDKQKWYEIDEKFSTLSNRIITITFGPDLIVQGNRLRGITRFIYESGRENFAVNLDVHGCGYAEYQHIDGLTEFHITEPTQNIIEAAVTMGGCVDVLKKYRLYKDLPILEIEYEKLDLLWWEDFYSFPRNDNRVYAIYGIDENIDSLKQARYRKMAEEKCGHNHGDCFLEAAGTSVEKCTYKGHLIFGFYDLLTQNGLGFVIPTRMDLHDGFKLWSMFNYESFPFYGMEKDLPLRRWIFVTTGGRQGILEAGKQIADLESDGKNLTHF